MRAVIAEDEVGVLGNRGLEHGARVKVLGWNVRLSKRLVIHVNLSIDDANVIAGNPDYAFDVALGRIIRKPENDDIATVNLWSPAILVVVNQLVYKNAFAIVQAWQHGSAFDLHRLDYEDDNE